MANKKIIWNQLFQKMITEEGRLRRRFKLDSVGGKKITAEISD